MHLHTESAGDGDPVVFLHGVTGSGRTYRWLEREGAIRLDFRGHGESDRAPGTYRIGDYVADAVTVLESLDGPAALVGHSLGGVVAWSVAQQRPELVTRVFLEDPPLYMGEPAAHAENQAIPIFAQTRDAIARWRRDGTGVEDVQARLAAMPFLDGTAGDAMHADALAARAYSLLRLDPEVIDRILDGSLLEGTDTESPVTVPVFVLASDPELSALTPAHEARLAASHPDVEVVRLPGASHSIHDERAHRDEYTRRLSAFLEDRHATAGAGTS
jgi:pimeloyl-ACP methyl ester carboxylesterase